MPLDISDVLSKLPAFRTRSLDGAKAGLAGAAAGITLDMRDSHTHGDQTGATHASYTAYVVGRGEDGSSALSVSAAAVESLNPGHVATAAVAVEGELGVIFTAPTDYQEKLETENAGAKAELGPIVAVSGDRCTIAVARGAQGAL